MIKGKGFYIWNADQILEHMGTENVQEIARKAKAAAIEHVIVKIADGEAVFPMPERDPGGCKEAVTSSLINALRNEGIEVWGWTFAYGKGCDPERQAQVFADRAHQFSLSGLVIDAEDYGKYTWSDRAGSERACQYIRRLRQAMADTPDLILGLSSYRYIRYHESFPFTAFMNECDVAMPQVYWVAQSGGDPVRNLQDSYEDYKARFPNKLFLPTGAAYGEYQGSGDDRWFWTATPEQIIRFMDQAKVMGMPAVTFWSWEHTYNDRQNCKYQGTDLWDAIAHYSYSADQSNPEPQLADGFDAPVGTEAERRVDKLWPGAWYDAFVIDFGVSGFNRRYYDSTGNLAYHTGVDLNLANDLDRDAPVYAVASGIVTFAGKKRVWGNIVIIRHDPLETGGRHVYSRSAHLSQISVSAGHRVYRGQYLGRIGRPEPGFFHLHFDISTTEALFNNPVDWPQKDSKRVSDNYVDPGEFICQHRPNGAGKLHDGATFVPSDDAIPDGSVMEPGQHFTQYWVMRNTGSKPWNQGYKLVRVGGKPLGAPEDQVDVPACVPGQQVTVKVPFVAPQELGSHESIWRLCNEQSAFFGPQVQVLIKVERVINDAESYGVRIVPTQIRAGETYWHVIHVHHLLPDENKGRHNVFVDVLDESGKRCQDQRLRIGWTWEGRQSDQPAVPKPLDKPATEPAGDVPIDSERQRIEVWIEGDGIPSEHVVNMHTRHGDEFGSTGEKWNYRGHHSFHVVFQRTRR